MKGGTHLVLADSLKLPLDAVTQTFLILGKRGSGKSSTATTMAEQMIRARLTIAVLDPVDVWWGLKAGADGRASGGLEVYVFGGDHQDLPLEPTAGALMADIVVDERINVVMVVRSFSNREKARFVADFADRLYKRNRKAMHLFVEEAHEFMPQQPFKGEEEMLGRMLRLEKSGRTCGIGMSAITQRPPALSKTATTQAEILVQHRVKGPQDIEAFRLWVKYNQEEDRVGEVMASLASLGVGEGWWWSPGWPDGDPLDLRRVQFHKPSTFDSRATPKAGQEALAPKSTAPVDLARLGERMAATVERQKADDPKELRRRIAELERQLRAKPTPTQAPAPKVVEIPVLPHALDTAIFKAINEQHAALTTAVAAAVTAVRDQEQKVRDRAPLRPGSKMFPPPPTSALSRDSVHGRIKNVTAAPGDNGHLPRGARDMLRALASMRRPLTQSEICTLAKVPPRSSTYRNYRSMLKVGGYMIEDDGKFWLTDPKGFEMAGPVEGPKTPSEIHAMWATKFPAKVGLMLEVLMREYPNAISKETLGGMVDVDPATSTFRNYFSMLKSNGLVTTAGVKATASSSLFPTEA